MLKEQPWGQWAWEKNGCTVDQCQLIRSIIRNNRSNTEEYELKHQASVFLQGYDEGRGWVLLEFWCQGREFVPFLQYLEARLGEQASGKEIQRA